MRTYQFYQTATGNPSIQLVNSGWINWVTWASQVGTVAGGDGVIAELSQQGFSQMLVNNPTGVISIFRSCIGAASAASIAPTGFTFQQSGLWVPVKVGDLIYLNLTVTGTQALRCLFGVLESGDR